MAPTRPRLLSLAFLFSPLHSKRYGLYFWDGGHAVLGQAIGSAAFCVALACQPPAVVAAVLVPMLWFVGAGGGFAGLIEAAHVAKRLLRRSPTGWNLDNTADLFSRLAFLPFPAAPLLKLAGLSTGFVVGGAFALFAALVVPYVVVRNLERRQMARDGRA